MRRITAEGRVGDVPATVTQLDIMEGFKCKCAACRRSCCNDDWEIQISRAEYEEDVDPALGDALHRMALRGIRLNPVGDERSFACCATGENGLCALMTPEGLCGWQVERGRCPGVACDEFPRTYLGYLDGVRMFATGACEAVLEALVEKTGPLKLVERSVDDAFAWARPGLFDPNVRMCASDFERRPLMRWYPQLVAWGMAILQDRSLPLDDRMVVLAHAMALVDYLERQRRTEELPVAMQRLLEPSKVAALLERFEGVEIGPHALLAVVVRTLTDAVRKGSWGRGAFDALRALGVRLEDGGSGSAETRDVAAGTVDTEVYRRRKAALADYMAEKQVFFEHVMVCEYLRCMVPFSCASAWESFRCFAGTYALHKGLVCASFDAPPADKELVDVLVELHRKVIHRYTFADDLLRMGDEIGLQNLDAMIALVKG